MQYYAESPLSTKWLTAALITVIATGIVRSTAEGQSLSLVDLGVGVSAYGINSDGQITGCAPASGGAAHAFVYSAGVMTDLGALGGVSSCGYAINDNGQITGYADTATASHAFLYSSGAMTDLGTVGGVPTSAGVSININGDIVGYAWPNAPFAPLQPPGLYGAAAQVVPAAPGAPSAHAFLYSHGIITDLFPSPPGPFAPFFAFAINDGGEIAGDIAAGCGILCPYGTAFTLVAGGQSNLPDLPGNDGAIFLTAVTGINNTGQIVAYGMDPLAYMHGVVYTNGVQIDLGNNTEALAINSHGDVVGFKLGNSAIGLYTNIGNDMSPFIYSNGAKRDLNLPGVIPTGINDSGWIIANHLTLNHAYVLQPSSVSLSPFGLSFGSVVLGQSQSAACGSCSVTLTNNTTNAIPVAGVSTAGPFAQSNDCDISLAPGSSCIIMLRFTPTIPDTALGSLTVDAGGSQYATLLTGAATIQAQVSASTMVATVNVPFTLTWAASPGSTCTAGGDTQFTGPVPVSGSKAIKEPAEETVTFTLSCTENSQTAQGQVAVTVNPGPTGGGGGVLDLVSVGVLLTLLARRNSANLFQPRLRC